MSCLRYHCLARVSITGYRPMDKVSRFRWIHISALLIALSLAIASVPTHAEAQGTSPAPNVQSPPDQIHAR
jgi:hypothetical protein